jgi:hypothetical protein
MELFVCKGIFDLIDNRYKIKGSQKQSKPPKISIINYVNIGSNAEDNSIVDSE